MKIMFLGEYIRNRRLELGLTQEQLCEGICEPMTISRLENGVQTPGRNRINALLQRLGLPDDRYYALLSKNEMEIEALEKEIISCNIHHDTENGLKNIEKLEKIIENDDYLTRQFILRSKALLGTREGPYSYDEQLEMLMETIRMTVPKFDLENINKSIYSFDEVKIINQIALAYGNNGKHKKAVDIFDQLLKYIQGHNKNILQSGGLLPLIAFNYARELDLCKRYEDAIEIAELGRQSCVKYGHYQYWPGIIAIMAESHYFLGNKPESENLYHQAYYLYIASEDKRNAEIIKTEAMNYLSLQL